MYGVAVRNDYCVYSVWSHIRPRTNSYQTENYATKRKYIATEIVETERRYIQDLYSLCTVLFEYEMKSELFQEYQQPLLDALVANPIISGEDAHVC